MTDYSKAKIYKIVGGDELYFGSTTQDLSKRFYTHKREYNKNKNYKCSSSILFEKYGVENCEIVLVENFECENKNELNRKEGEYILNNICVNQRVAGRTPKEYFKKYYDENKEIKQQKVKNWIVNNKDKIKEQRKKYRELNKDKLKEYQKAYWQNKKKK